MAVVYVTEDDTQLSKTGERLVVRKGSQILADIPLVKVDQVVVLGNVSLTPPAIDLLLTANIPVGFLTYTGRYRGALTPPFSKNSLLRRAQYRAAEDGRQTLELARWFVQGKLTNMRALMLRATRGERDAASEEAIRNVKIYIDKTAVAAEVDTVRGYEGVGSKSYFSVFGRELKEGWYFNGRSRRPPRDPVNALLSFGYTLLFNEVMSAVSLAGFDPYIGYLHAAKYSKPALALDLMEEFRPIIVDSVVKSVINKGVLQPDDLQEVYGTYELRKAGTRKFLEQYEARLRTEVNHPYFEYSATLRRCLHLQVRLVAKYLMGEIPAYQPFTSR